MPSGEPDAFLWSAHCSSLSARLRPPLRALRIVLVSQVLFGGVCPGTGLLRESFRSCGGVRSSLSG